MYVKIEGLPRTPTIDGVDFSQLSTGKHKQLIREYAPSNYSQFPEWMIVGKGKKPNTLRARKADEHGREIEEDKTDCQGMYSAQSFGHHDVFESFLEKIGLQWQNDISPGIPRAIDHIYLAPTLVALSKYTGLDMSLMKSAGTEVVETAINTAFQWWAQTHTTSSTVPKIIAPCRNFHGRTRTSRSLSSSDSSRKNIGPLLSNIIHVSFNDVLEIEQIWNENRGNVLAVIIELVQGEGGVYVAEKDYILEVHRMCQEHGALFIVDEIQTGAGRVGFDWAYEQFPGVKPDLLCAGKGIGGGLLPVSLVAGKREVMKCIKVGTEGATWSGTPIQCLAVLAAISTLDTYDLASEAGRKGEKLLEILHAVKKKYPEYIIDVRGKGLLVAVETVFPGSILSYRLFNLTENGIWAKETGENGRAIRFSPPLTITDEQIQEIGHSLETVIAQLIQSQTSGFEK